MGFDNPPVPWSELERRLSGRPAPAPPERAGPTHTTQGAQGAQGARGARGARGAWPSEPGDGGDSPAWSRKQPAYEPSTVRRSDERRVPYAELHAHSSFSFLDGASAPEELAEEAVRLGLTGLTLTDHDGMYGIVRFAEAADALGLATSFGA